MGSEQRARAVLAWGEALRGLEEEEGLGKLWVLGADETQSARGTPQGWGESVWKVSGWD